MKKSDIDRLKVKFATQPGEPNDRLLADFFGFGLNDVISLGDAITADLTPKTYGVGWWVDYEDLPTQTRILISDHLLACARAIPDNLIEAHVCLLELDHAVEDFQHYVQRGIGRRRIRVPAPRGPYEALTTYRVGAHFVGALRALGSALDCLAACIIGVGALPTDLVKADLTRARASLSKEKDRSPVLAPLAQQVEQAEVTAGPTGWLDWLIDMRNTEVHRGRRLSAWEPDVRTAGTESVAVGLRRQLPVDPELTEVEAWVQAGSFPDAYFDAPLPDVLHHAASSVQDYINTVCSGLLATWRARAANPDLLIQPAKQWRGGKTATRRVPFSGYPSARMALGEITYVGASDEVSYRMEAAAITAPGPHAPRPEPRIWQTPK